MINKAFNKIFVMGMALVMLFSVTFFGASNCEIYNPQVTELLRKIEELEEQARQQAERIALYEHRVNAIEDLKEFVSERGQENFTQENWILIQQYLIEGIGKINATIDKDAVDAAVDEVKYLISGVTFIVNSHGLFGGMSFCDGVDFCLYYELPKSTYTVIKDVYQIEKIIYEFKSFLCNTWVFDNLLNFLKDNYCENFFDNNYLVVVSIFGGIHGICYSLTNMTLDGKINISRFHHISDMIWHSNMYNFIIEVPRFFSSETFEINIYNSSSYDCPVCGQ
ncbi:MAG: hypothetical protein FWE03_04745 [Firmicutes bacterium]|nr:hypothetical protein [Bacillota bacterium]